ncbi:MAG: hypothetical protein KF836_00745 [Fimbriimonadaceae bacterium]|nr:hypothetical protein [Fimbriimonadaceae bacterium]
MKINIIRALRVGIVASLFAMLFGCGGQTGSTIPAGSMTLGIEWPEALTSRTIPTASNSIVVEIWKDGSKTHSVVIPRPQTSALIEDIPLGEVLVTASAYPVIDGSGVAQGSASTLAEIVEGPGNIINLTLASTITQVQIAASTTLTALQNTTIVATPKNSNGDVVLVSPTGINFQSSQPLVGTIGSTSGVFQALLMGTSTVTATESESGVSGQGNVTVKLGLSVLPASASLSIFGSQLFVATIVGSANTAVTWSVDGGASKGSINAAGLYTAPATPGTYTVRATSVADPTISRTATVTVTAGGGSIHIG